MAYRSKHGRIATAASLLIPYGIVIIFIAICLGDKDGKYDLSSAIEVNTLLRVTLILHGGYFFVLTPMFELMIEALPLPIISAHKFGKIPARPDNLFWMMSCLSAELFFVSTVIYLLMATQDIIQRWTLILPIAQCAYNMKNSLIWVFLGNICSPIKQRMAIMIIDWLFVGICFVIYIVVFFTA